MKDFIEQEIEKGLSIDEVFIYKNYDEIIKNYYSLQLNESYARYKGQYELCQYITLLITQKKLKEITFSKKELEDKNFENIFFDRITVKYGKFNNSGAYKGDIDKENFVIKHVHILVNEEDTKYESIFSVIAHELKHAWQDYKKIYDKEFTLDNLVASDKVYQECTKHLGKLTPKGLVSNIIYVGKKIEYDAYSSEFSSEFKKLLNKEKPTDINECPNLAKKIESYLYVLNINLFIECINNDKEFIGLQFSKNDILEEAKKVLNKDELTWQYFYNNYCRKIRKLFSKFCNIIANNYFEYSEELREERIKKITNESFDGVPNFRNSQRSFIVELLRQNNLIEYEER